MLSKLKDVFRNWYGRKINSDEVVINEDNIFKLTYSKPEKSCEEDIDYDQVLDDLFVGSSEKIPNSLENTVNTMAGIYSQSNLYGSNASSIETSQIRSKRYTNNEAEEMTQIYLDKIKNSGCRFSDEDRETYFSVINQGIEGLANGTLSGKDVYKLYVISNGAISGDYENGKRINFSYDDDIYLSSVITGFLALSVAKAERNMPCDENGISFEDRMGDVRRDENILLNMSHAFDYISGMLDSLSSIYRKDIKETYNQIADRVQKNRPTFMGQPLINNENIEKF